MASLESREAQPAALDLDLAGRSVEALSAGSPGLTRETAGTGCGPAIAILGFRLIGSACEKVPGLALSAKAKGEGPRSDHWG